MRIAVTAATHYSQVYRYGTKAAMIWLAAIRSPDGSFPQNSWINGTAYWSGFQLDEITVPILLAWQLHTRGVTLGQFDPCIMVLRATAYLILHGPVMVQERWEKNEGYSPSTLATVTASLVCVAEFVEDRDEPDTAEFILAYADWLAAHLEEWTVTTKGELAEGYRRHFIRINPANPQAPDPHSGNAEPVRSFTRPDRDNASREPASWCL